nr:Uncharacterised protein [Klebsiella pneumoniae]
MVKVAQVTAVGNTSSERFRHALSLAIPPNCRLSGVAVESLDIRQGQASPRGKRWRA